MRDVGQPAWRHEEPSSNFCRAASSNARISRSLARRRSAARRRLPGRIPHDFRRTAVRNLERAAVPRSTAMAMVGHKTESIYRRYAIVDEVMRQEGGAKLAAYVETTGQR